MSDEQRNDEEVEGHKWPPKYNATDETAKDDVETAEDDVEGHVHRRS